jgi:hypothetical protein
MEEFKAAESPLRWAARACSVNDFLLSDIFVKDGRAYACDRFTIHKCDTSLKDGLHDPYCLEPVTGVIKGKYPLSDINKLLYKQGDEFDYENDPYVYKHISLYNIKDNYYCSYFIDRAINGLKLISIKSCKTDNGGMIIGRHEFGEFAVMSYDRKSIKEEDLKKAS